MKIISILLLLNLNLTYAKDLNKCKQLYINILKNSSLNTWCEKIDAWKTNKVYCVERGSYEYYLADAYEQSGNRNEARRILLKAVSNSNKKYRQWILFELASLEFNLHKLNSCINHVNILIREFSRWVGGYAIKASCELEKRNYKSAIENFERSNSIEKTSGAYEELTLAYYSLKKYRESLNAFNQSAKMNIEIFRKKDFVLCAVYSAFRLKEYYEAENLLDKLKQNIPNIIHDPDYQKAQSILTSLKKDK